MRQVIETMVIICLEAPTSCLLNPLRHDFEHGRKPSLEGAEPFFTCLVRGCTAHQLCLDGRFELMEDLSPWFLGTEHQTSNPNKG